MYFSSDSSLICLSACRGFLVKDMISICASSLSFSLISYLRCVCSTF